MPTGMRTAAMTALFMCIAVGAAFAYPAPDTGVTQCYNATAQLTTCPENGTAFFGQDGSYRWPYRDRNATQNGTGVVTDQTTGLLWEQGESDRERWDDAATYCEGLGTDGITNWRLPNVYELAYLADLSNNSTDPAIATVFTSARSEEYWTSTPFAGDPENEAWLVDFRYGNVTHKVNTTDASVRCVSGDEVAFATDFRSTGDGAFVDTKTDLMWWNPNPLPVTQEKKGSRAFVETQLAWQDALAFCENGSAASRTDWRLPDRNELLSLFDYRAFTSSIDPSDADYWSSTTNSTDPARAWTVNFDSGLSFSNGTKSVGKEVLCARTAPQYFSTNATSTYEGDTIAIAGEFLGEQSGIVFFGNDPVVPSVWNNTSTEAVVPVGKDSAPVQLRTAAGTVLDAFTFTWATPQLNSVNATVAEAGDTITLGGENFGTTNGTVTFGGTVYTIGQANWTNTGISFTVPSGSNAVPVSVTTAGGAETGARNFFYQPVIGSTNSTDVTIGDQIAVRGSNFGQTEGTIYFGNTLVSQIISWSENEVVFVIPGGTSSGPVNIKVVPDGAPDNQVTNTVQVAYETMFLPFVNVLLRTPPPEFIIPDTGVSVCMDNTKVIPCPQPGQPFYGQDAHYEVPSRQREYADTDGQVETLTDSVTGYMWTQETLGLFTWTEAKLACGNTTIGGYTDWELPTIKELNYLVDRTTPLLPDAFTPLPGSLGGLWSSTSNSDLVDLAWIVDSSGAIFSFDKPLRQYILCVRKP